MTDALRLNISPEERIALKAEFEKLESVEQKYKFWQERLKRNYYLWAFFEQTNIQDFSINPTERADIEILNKLIYEDSASFLNPVRKPQVRVSKTSFMERIESSPEKEALIEYELNIIDEFVSSKRQVQIMPDPENYEKCHFFIVGFEDYYLRKKEMDWGEKVYQAHLLAEKLNGIDLAKYREFVKNYLKQPKKNPELKLNGEQKFLVLHHLGLGGDLKANTYKSVLFDFFIDELKANTIRPMLSNVKKYETEDNLYALLDFFRLINHDPKVSEIQAKLDKLKKKR